MDIRHIVLAGDSIFDNDDYVLGEPGVIEQMRKSIPENWSASKIAVDGDCIADVATQLPGIPSNTTDMIVSVGGNDARRHAALLDKINTVSELPRYLVGPLAGFRAEYAALLQELNGRRHKLHVCTIYTAIPFDDALWRQYAPLAIEAFNAVILDEAFKAVVPVIRLDEICVDETDFSSVSPIEPSSTGGQKIVDHIIQVLSQPTLETPQTSLG